LKYLLIMSCKFFLFGWFYLPTDFVSGIKKKKRRTLQSNHGLISNESIAYKRVCKLIILTPSGKGANARNWDELNHCNLTSNGLDVSWPKAKCTYRNIYLQLQIFFFHNNLLINFSVRVTENFPLASHSSQRFRIFVKL